MVYQTASHGRLDLPCGLHQFVSLTEGTALLLSPNGCFNPPSDRRITLLYKSQAIQQKCQFFMKISAFLESSPQF